MYLNKWEQNELDSFEKLIESMIQENGMIDYRKMLLVKAELLLKNSRNRKKNFRKWVCDALCIGKNYLNQHQI